MQWVLSGGWTTVDSVDLGAVWIRTFNRLVGEARRFRST